MNAKTSVQKNEVTIINFVSGKGGVGKTMLAVAAAKELSNAQPTLVLDLDFFNRGLSGLLSQGEKTARIDSPSFLGSTSGKKKKTKWQINKVSRKLFSVTYPDVPQEGIEFMDCLSIQKLSSQLLDFIQEAAAIAKCNTVVLDCHGGPDSLSFAACLISQYSLLISEPDRITMYGTLHFLRKLNSVTDSKQPNIHLVFNKVVEAFSPRFLRNLYNENLSDYFNNRPLLAIFPLEVYLTKEFEKYPFVTEIHPRSTLAEKMQVLLVDLLHDDRPDALSPMAKSLPSRIQNFRRNSFGGLPGFLKLEFVVAAGFIILLLNLIGNILDSLRIPVDFLYDILYSYGYYTFFDNALLLWAAWMISAILLNWNQTLDRLMVNNAQQKKIFRLIIYAFGMVLVWYLPLTFLLYAVDDIINYYSWSDLTTSDSLYFSVILILAIVVSWTWGKQLYRAYREARYAKYRIDPVTRLVAFIVLILLSATSYPTLF